MVLRIERLNGVSYNVVWMHFDNGRTELVVTNDDSAYAKACELARLINSAAKHNAMRMAS